MDIRPKDGHDMYRLVTEHEKKKNLNIAQANYSNRFKWIAPTANNKFDFNNIVQTQL